MDELKLLERITVNPEIFGGKAIIRGRRLAVEHVLGMLGEGDNPETILEGYPWLKQKIAEVTGGPAYGGHGWLPVIEYGVRVNIEPLKVARVLHRAADRIQ